MGAANVEPAPFTVPDVPTEVVPLGVPADLLLLLEPQAATTMPATSMVAIKAMRRMLNVISLVVMLTPVSDVRARLVSTRCERPVAVW